MVKFMRDMFDQTAFFDADQLTTCLLVSTRAPSIVDGCCSVAFQFMLFDVGKHYSSSHLCKIQIFYRILRNIPNLRVSVCKDLTNYKYDKMVTKSLAVLNKYFSSKMDMFKSAVQAQV